jgi:4-diphosphocytidyl-2-C-methyl-D-erythritol kinase
VLAFAKINLTLEILARREDGYHTLRSLMLPVGLADELTFTPAAHFSFTCDPPALAADNLVVRAFERIGLGAAPFAVTLKKSIPAGAGLGGGSSDAAAVFRAAMQGDFGPVAPRDWIDDARSLGSDIPFFLVESGALVEGTGERVTAIGALPPWWVVLVMPDVHVATADAYRRLAAGRERTPAPTRPRSDSATLRALAAVQRGDYDAAIAAATNDFEPIVRDAYPPVAAVLDALRAAGAACALLSGSGGACFALCRDEREARALHARFDAPPGARTFVVPLAPAPAWRAPLPA